MVSEWSYNNMQKKIKKYWGESDSTNQSTNLISELIQKIKQLFLMNWLKIWDTE